jgi:hypothetical protein
VEGERERDIILKRTEQTTHGLIHDDDDGDFEWRGRERERRERHGREW